MLAKPEYYSPPDEVCCWPGRRSGAADTGSRRKQLAGVPWGSCWYGQPAEAAGGAPWRSCWYGQPAEAAGGSVAEGWSEAAVCAEKLAAGRATMRRHRGRACRWAGDYAAASWKSLPLGERRRCGKRKVQSSLGMVQSIIGKRLNGSNQHFTPFLFQCHRPHTAIPIIIKYKRAA